MRSWIRRFMVGWLVLLPSLVALIWGSWPLEYAHRAMPVRPGDLQFSPGVRGSTDSSAKVFVSLDGEKTSPATDPAGSAAPSLELTWPARLRLGDPGRIILTMHAGAENPASGQSPGISPQQIAYHLLVETNLEISGLLAVPVGDISEPMQPGHPVNFYWSVRPDRQGAYSGMIWVHLRFIPVSGDSSVRQAEPIRRLLTAQRIEIETQDLFGLGGPQARVLGIVGVVLACFLELELVISRLWRRLRRKPESANA